MKGVPGSNQSSAAERMRRYRQRRRDRLRCLTIELLESEIDALVYRGWLAPEQRNNQFAILVAFHKFLDASLAL